MKLLESFRAEHEVIEEVAGALYRWAVEGGNREDAALFARFLAVYSAGFHHAREDELLVPALVEHLEVPSDRGPLMVIQEEHRRLEELTTRLGASAGRETAREIARILWEHIDKENSVLFTEAEERLHREGVRELPDRPMSGEEAEALALGKTLVERYPPLEDPEVIRGEGCIACSAFAVTCRGVEAEWWNTWEWENHFRKEHGG